LFFPISAIAIDFRATYSCVDVFKRDRVDLIADEMKIKRFHHRIVLIMMNAEFQ
jgi:hypothetical protein